MGKAMGTVVAMFSAGGASMALLTGRFGGWAEAAALGLVGLGLFASSHLLAGVTPASAPLGQELKVNG